MNWLMKMVGVVNHNQRQIAAKVADRCCSWVLRVSGRVVVVVVDGEVPPWGG